MRIACGLYSPYANDFTLPLEQQLLQIDTIFAVFSLNGTEVGWIDGVDPRDPILVPVQAIEGYSDLGTLDEYLSEEFHTQIGDELGELLRLSQEEDLSATVLVRALAIMHNESAMGAQEAVEQSLRWGLTLLRAGAMDRYTFSLAEMLRRP